MNATKQHADMMGLRVLRLAGCGAECRIEHHFNVALLADVVTHVCGEDAIRTTVDRLRNVESESATELRLIAWIRAHHDAIRAYRDAA